MSLNINNHQLSPLFDISLTTSKGKNVILSHNTLREIIQNFENHYANGQDFSDLLGTYALNKNNFVTFIPQNSQEKKIISQQIANYIDQLMVLENKQEKMLKEYQIACLNAFLLMLSLHIDKKEAQLRLINEQNQRENEKITKNNAYKPKVDTELDKRILMDMILAYTKLIKEIDLELDKTEEDISNLKILTKEFDIIIAALEKAEDLYAKATDEELSEFKEEIEIKIRSELPEEADTIFALPKLKVVLTPNFSSSIVVETKVAHKEDVNQTYAVITLQKSEKLFSLVLDYITLRHEEDSRKNYYKYETKNYAEQNLKPNLNPQVSSHNFNPLAVMRVLRETSSATLSTKQEELKNLKTNKNAMTNQLGALKRLYHNTSTNKSTQSPTPDSGLTGLVKEYEKHKKQNHAENSPKIK